MNLVLGHSMYNQPVSKNFVTYLSDFDGLVDDLKTTDVDELKTTRKIKKI